MASKALQELQRLGAKKPCSFHSNWCNDMRQLEVGIQGLFSALGVADTEVIVFVYRFWSFSVNNKAKRNQNVPF